MRPSTLCNHLVALLESGQVGSTVHSPPPQPCSGQRTPAARGLTHTVPTSRPAETVCGWPHTHSTPSSAQDPPPSKGGPWPARQAPQGGLVDTTTCHGASQAFLPLVGLAAKMREKWMEGERVRVWGSLFRGHSKGSTF